MEENHILTYKYKPCTRRKNRTLENMDHVERPYFVQRKKDIYKQYWWKTNHILNMSVFDKHIMCADKTCKLHIFCK